MVVTRLLLYAASILGMCDTAFIIHSVAEIYLFYRWGHYVSESLNILFKFNFKK